MAGRALAKLLPEFPDVAVQKVEFLTHRSLAREAGVSSVPTLVHGEQKLTAILLSKKNIRGFLESL